MAEATYATTTRIPAATLWEFVREMDHWAPFVTGYQRHEKTSERESVWTLKGDLGVMSRTLTFRVRIVEWSGPERVRFELEGLNEPMRGAGSFAIEPADAPGAPDGPAPAAADAGPRRGRLLRLLESLWRRLLRALGGRVEREAPPAPGAAAARMRFHLRIDPGGPMAPMINAMITPMMRPAAEDLANRILAHLESRSESRSESAPRPVA